MTVRSLASATKSSPAEVERWLQDVGAPPTAAFHRMAKALGRPESFFFLPKPPTTPKISAAFRTHSSGGGKGQEILPEIHEGENLRLAQRAQKAAAWINGNLGLRPDQKPLGDVSIPAEKFAETLRLWLDWSFDHQISDETTEARVNHDMRSALQDRGILVLHLSMTPQIVRGFSLPHETAPLIAINTQDPYPARLFSYMHECAHLTLQSESFCLTGQNYGIERWCNQVAAAVLLPRDRFSDEVRRRFSGPITKIDQVLSLRRKLRVSAPAIAIRLEQVGLAPEGLFDSIIQQPQQKKARGGRPDPERPPTKPRVRLRSYGRHFVNTVLKAEESGALNRHHALEILQVSSAELDGLRQIAATGDEG